MEFDWLDASFDLKSVTPKEVEETFEDPFSIRLLPDGADDQDQARYFNLGKTVSNRPLFTLFWTDGKRYRAILSRDMTPEELAFYDRKNSELG